MAEKAKHILVAEDNAATAAVIRFNLERKGLDVTIAGSGLAAWNLLQEEDFDLVISDVQMPGISGSELCQRMRQVPALADIPIIMLTAKSFEMDPDAYLERLTVSAIVPKPFSPRELARLVERCIKPCAADA
jgi:CheY-like chemotaxis protein